MYLHIYVYIYIYLYLFTMYLSIYLSIFLFIYLSIYIFTYVYIYILCVCVTSHRVRMSMKFTPSITSAEERSTPPAGPRARRLPRRRVVHVVLFQWEMMAIPMEKDDEMAQLKNSGD